MAGVTATKPAARAVFTGSDIHGHVQLWVTDGTSAGTSELIVEGAASSGLVGSDPYFAILNGKALFVGDSANSGSSVWATDGTAAGTIQLTKLRDPFNDTPLFPSNITVLGTKALFTGNDPNGPSDLWVTDGTSAGTRSLKVRGANSFGLFEDGSTPPDLTALGQKLLFAGVDAGENTNLWVTDGTTGGTHELKPAGESAGSLYPRGITVFGDHALLSGIGVTGVTLWVTDGTVAGTRPLKWAPLCPASR